MAEKYFAQPSGTGAQEHFANVPKADIERSKFDRSHGHKTTFNAGELIPVYVDEILPGDTFHMKSTAFARLSTPLKPVMDNMYLDTHFFFVPTRLVWNEFQRFMGERTTPEEDNTGITVPKALLDIKAGTLPIYTLANRMGVPISSNAGSTLCFVNMLPFRAYQLIWNDWYRDENLQQPLTIVKSGTGDSALWQTFACMKRNKRRDYFTSCLPWPQKGDPVYVPLGTSAPVVTNDKAITIQAFGQNADKSIVMAGSSNALTYGGTQIGTNNDATFGIESGLYTDLTSATAITINDLRTAFQVQRLLERDARGGTRYIELILSHFGVHSDDARLQRPEYLGGGSSPVNINPIASTAPTAEQPQGALAAFGTAVGAAGFSKSFTEHGYIIGLCSVRADLTYQQGLERMWSRTTRYDFYWPALAHLGEQGVLNSELMVTGSATDSQVFGYQERYAEYRYKPSRVTGEFQSAVTTSLDVWHLAQEFATLPGLNSQFIEENPPIDRIVAVPSEPDFLMDVWFSLQCERPMPVYAVPGLIDHF
ncbi:MAG: major capsid protein [Microviridae sp.]|nr:MAG: major capsid protein [Microviridae sp.]